MMMIITLILIKNVSKCVKHTLSCQFDIDLIVIHKIDLKNPYLSFEH